MEVFLPFILLLLVSAAFTLLDIRFHNWVSGVILLLLYLAISCYLIHDRVTLFIFLVAVTMGYLTDCIGVYTKGWRYRTKNKYSIWAGMGWAALTLTVFRTFVFLQFGTVFFFLLPALFILWKRNKHFLKATSSGLPLLFAELSMAIISPQLFLLSFSVGIIIEFLAVEGYKIWSYPEISYLQIGTGYATFMVFVYFFTQLLFSRVEVISWIPVVAVIIFYLNDLLFSELRALASRKKKKKVNNRFSWRIWEWSEIQEKALNYLRIS
jgi:hypothetical protein